MAKAMKKQDDTDLPIGRIAKVIVNTLIGKHGLRRAMDIGVRIHEQMLAEVKSQIRRHPEEWDEETRRGVLGTTELGAPAPPEVPAVPTV